MKKLPLGIQTFEKLRKENYLYIDKTRFIFELVSQGSAYFLSRPRRFGKSLTLSTLAALFEGKRELFKGLYIDSKSWEWKKWPVIRFDFSNFSESNEPEKLEERIESWVTQYAESQQVFLKSSGYERRFEELLQKLPEQAVILIDEYDKPLLNNIMSPEKANRIKDILKGFFSIIKSQDAHIRFAFLTGVTKFTRISVFSGLNNLIDLTMRPDFADICGYTEDEISEYFKKELTDISHEMNLPEPQLRNEIKDWYNGFRFSAKNVKVYNPVSVMNFINERIFKAWWFETATPTFLIQLMKLEGFAPELLENITCPESSFSSYEVENLKALPILFQSGYLTIRNYDNVRQAYSLGFPNREVKSAFLENLLHEFNPREKTGEAYPLYKLEEGLREKDFKSFFEYVNILFARVPYDVHLPYEKYWQSLFYMIFTLLGYYIEVEYKTAKGRIDAFIDFEDTVYIFEFKFTANSDGARQLALAGSQIRDREYARRFKGSGKEIIMLPAVFEYKNDKAVVLWDVIK